MRDRVTRIESRQDSEERYNSDRFARLAIDFGKVESSIAGVISKIDSIATELSTKIESLGDKFMTSQLAAASGKARESKNGDKFEKYAMRGVLTVLLFVIGYLLINGPPYPLRVSAVTQEMMHGPE